jgi:hypothetical protein
MWVETVYSNSLIIQEYIQPGKDVPIFLTNPPANGFALFLPTGYLSPVGKISLKKGARQKSKENRFDFIIALC